MRLLVSLVAVLAIALSAAGSVSAARGSRMPPHVAEDAPTPVRGGVRGPVDPTALPVPQMQYDQAAVGFVVGTPAPPFNVSVWYTSDDCSLNCASWQYALVDVNSSVPYQTIDTQYGATLQFRTESFFSSQSALLATVRYHFGEFGQYTFVLSGADPRGTDFAVAMRTDVDASSHTYTPLINALLIVLAIAIAWPVILYLYRRQRREEAEKANAGLHQPLTSGVSDDGSSAGGAPEAKAQGTVNTAPGAAGAGAGAGAGAKKGAAPAAAARKKDRLRSLDTFRGLCLSIMIFVNYNGGGYWWFAHSTWNGLTVADLVFPWFIWMMGVSMAISFDSLFRQRLSTADLMYKIVRRSCILFALGLLVSNTGSTLENLRIPGVLQRFGVSFFGVSLILVFVPKRNGNGRDYGSSGNPQSERHALSDITDYVYQWLVVAALTGVWLAVTFGLDVPGCGRGYIGPGGLADGGKYAQCTGGAAGYIDAKVLGTHIYGQPTCQAVYLTGAYDPEGILGCLTSIVITYLGVATGRVLLYYPQTPERLKRWVVMGLLWGSIAMGLSGGTRNGGVIPLCKNLWSLSFILAQAGMGCLALSVCYVLIDVLDVWNGAPFIYPGMNSIAVYVGSEMFQPAFPFSLAPVTTSDNTHGFQLSQNLIAVGLWQLGAYYLYTEDVIIKI